jgi:signal peptidase I
MRTRHVRKLISSALGLIVLGSIWFYFAPTQLGGTANYVVTHGVSMEPRFHTGDLAIVRSQSTYHVGEIVAYENKMLHTIVLHRIIGRDGSRYIFKGDNNNFVDFEHPAYKQLIGALWIHIPGAGATLKSIRSPALVGILVATGMLLFTGAAFTRRRRRRGNRRRDGSGPEHTSAPTLPHFSEPVLAILAAGIVVLLPFVMLAVLAFTRPSDELHAAQVPYKQSGSFSYSANAAPGPAYPGNRAVTGDPLFTRVLNDVDLSFDYRFSSHAKSSLAGTASLAATLTSTSGWSKTLPLGSSTHFKGDHAVVTGTLDLASLLALMNSVETATRVSGSYTLTIAPKVSASGRLEGRALNASFAPEVQFSLTELEAKPILGATATAATTTTPGKSTPSVFTPSTSGSVSSKRSVPLFVSIKVARLSVATARSIALIGIAAIVCALLAVLALARPKLRGGDESSGIRARYGHLIVPVAHVWQLPGVPVIDVSDMDALARIAEHYERSILHESSPEGESFWVTDESGQFRYALGASAPASQQPLATPGPLQVPNPLDALAGDVPAQAPDLSGELATFDAQSTQEFAAAAAPAAQEGWAAGNLVDALTQESQSWRVAGTPAGADSAPAFARFAELD